jgi:hypothetical protein
VQVRKVYLQTHLCFALIYLGTICPVRR